MAVWGGPTSSCEKKRSEKSNIISCSIMEVSFEWEVYFYWILSLCEPNTTPVKSKKCRRLLRLECFLVYLFLVKEEQLYDSNKFSDWLKAIKQEKSRDSLSYRFFFFFLVHFTKPLSFIIVVSYS